jgi:hypothetical protein
VGDVLHFPAGACPAPEPPPTVADLHLQLRELEEEWALMHARLEVLEASRRQVGPLDRVRLALSRLLDRLFSAVGL